MIINGKKTIVRVRIEDFEKKKIVLAAGLSFSFSPHPPFSQDSSFLLLFFFFFFPFKTFNPNHFLFLIVYHLSIEGNGAAREEKEIKTFLLILHFLLPLSAKRIFFISKLRVPMRRLRETLDKALFGKGPTSGL